MSGKRTGKILVKSAAKSAPAARRAAAAAPRAGTDWKRVRVMSDGPVKRALAKDADARPTDVNFWKKAKLVMPSPKQTITIRLDADLLKWLRSQPSYQTRINAVLRTYMQAHT